jgi:hypothetical protein
LREHKGAPSVKGGEPDRLLLSILARARRYCNSR